MRSLFAGIGALLLLALHALPAGAAPGRSAVQRDVEGYAIATCMTRQKEPLLKDQGYAWLDVIVQRSRGDIEDFKAVGDAVVAQLAKEPLPMARQENDPMHAKALPVLQCAEIIDEPPVHAAVDTAIKKLTPAYRHAKR